MIAEKRSVAFAIAQALGDVRQGDGYVSAGGALISWAQGHLVELSDPEEYTDMPWSARKWTMESLPSIRNHGVGVCAVRRARCTDTVPSPNCFVPTR